MNFFKATAHADSTEEAHALIERDFGPVARIRGDVTYDSQVAGDERFSVAAVKFGGAFSSVAALDTVVMVSAAGEYGWEAGGESGNLGQKPVVLDPQLSLRGNVRDVDIRFVAFSVLPLENLTRATFADDSLYVRFDQRGPISEAYTRSIHKTLQYATDIAATEAFDADLVRASLYQLLSRTLLHGFALSGDPAVRALNSAALLRGYQRAVGFIDGHVSLPITIEDIAAAAGLSVEQLDYAFSAHSVGDGTASGQLRDARLSAAHEDLVRGDPTFGDTVGAIALRWGFSPSRFAAVYRKTYGANPKWVLDR